MHYCKQELELNLFCGAFVNRSIIRRCVANDNGMHRCKFKVTNLVKLEVPYGDKLRFCVNFMEQCPGKIAGIYPKLTLIAD
jgi:hypothetical protein